MYSFSVAKIDSVSFTFYFTSLIPFWLWTCPPFYYYDAAPFRFNLFVCSSVRHFYLVNTVVLYFCLLPLEFAEYGKAMFSVMIAPLFSGMVPIPWCSDIALSCDPLQPIPIPGPICTSPLLLQTPLHISRCIMRNEIILVQRNFWTHEISFDLFPILIVPALCFCFCHFN